MKLLRQRLLRTWKISVKDDYVYLTFYSSVSVRIILERRKKGNHTNVKLSCIAVIECMYIEHGKVIHVTYISFRCHLQMFSCAYSEWNDITNSVSLNMLKFVCVLLVALVVLSTSKFSHTISTSKWFTRMCSSVSNF